jgi:NAD(P)H-dependent flavin oxidoreductase YrpB (nitropropane dioxygenase family)
MSTSRNERRKENKLKGLLVGGVITVTVLFGSAVMIMDKVKANVVTKEMENRTKYKYYYADQKPIVKKDMPQIGDDEMDVDNTKIGKSDKEYYLNYDKKKKYVWFVKCTGDMSKEVHEVYTENGKVTSVEQNKEVVAETGDCVNYEYNLIYGRED